LALRYLDGVLVELIAPNSRVLYWKPYSEQRFERVDIAERFDVPPHIASLVVAGQRSQPRVLGVEGVTAVVVPEHGVGMLYAHGKLDRLLGPGLHAFYRFNRDLKAEVVDLRVQAMEVTGQEILTRDKVALRVNLSAGYRIGDAKLAFGRQAKPADTLHRALQFGLRAAVGTRTLDELLESRDALDAVLASHVRQAIEGFGLIVESVGVKDIVLPGDMQAILAKVVEATWPAFLSLLDLAQPRPSGRS
jgi:hypothetical protein